MQQFGASAAYSNDLRHAGVRAEDRSGLARGACRRATGGSPAGPVLPQERIHVAGSRQSATHACRIEQTLAGTPDDIDTNADGSSGPRRRATVPWVASGGLAAASIAMLLLWRPWVDAPAPAPVRVSAEWGADLSVSTVRREVG